MQIGPRLNLAKPPIFRDCQSIAVYACLPAGRDRDRAQLRIEKELLARFLRRHLGLSKILLPNKIQKESSYAEASEDIENIDHFRDGKFQLSVINGGSGQFFAGFQWQPSQCRQFQCQWPQCQQQPE